MADQEISKNALKKQQKAEEAARKKAEKEAEKAAKKAAEPVKAGNKFAADEPELDPTQYYENRLKAMASIQVCFLVVDYASKIHSAFDLG